MSETKKFESLEKEMLEIWKKPGEIRQLFAPNLTDKEFQFFMGLGQAMRANPFKREIWAVKYDKTKPAQIFCGRDFYRKKAQEQEDYDGHVSSAVYSNDKFKVVNGIPEHTFSQNNRGDLVSAYALAYKKHCRIPIFQYIELKEYDKRQSTWKEKPATMLEKVAEAQCFRKAWQGVFAGTYSEVEKDFVLTDAPILKHKTKEEPKQETVIDTKPEPEPENPDDNKPVGEDQLGHFKEDAAEKFETEQDVNNWIEKVGIPGVKCLADIKTQKQIRTFWAKLKRIKKNLFEKQ